MPLWQLGTRAVTRKLPKVIGPNTHALLDYGVAGIFLVAAARFWGRNRRAAMGALLCGGGKLANAMLSDYPGGAVALMSYKAHGRTDAAIAALTAATPQLMGFSDEEESRLFSAQALAETLIAGMTDFDYYEDHPREHRMRAAS
jgi:hypothetical protein